MINLLVDAGDDAVVVAMSDLVIVDLAGELIAIFDKVMVDGLIGGIMGIGVDMLGEFGIIVVAAMTDPEFIDTRLSLVEDALRCC